MGFYWTLIEKFLTGTAIYRSFHRKSKKQIDFDQTI